jgi:homoserine O-acetyltransferase
MSKGILLTCGTAEIGDLQLRSGAVLPEVRIAYATGGTLAPGRDNVVLVTHGFTSTHLFIGRASETSADGTWSGLVGPGRAIDTDRFFVISSNMLGSSYGSTAPASINPQTGKPFGPDFPAVTVADIVAAQRQMLLGMGIDRLIAVVGPSYGGFQALTWGVEYPGVARGLSATVTGLRAPGDTTVEGLRGQFEQDPNWNGGWHYDRGGIAGTMAALRERTMRLYGADEYLRDRFPDEAQREEAIRRQARAWGGAFDPNGMITLAAAAERYDVTEDLHRITARVLFVLSRTDKVFPPSIGPVAMQAFAAAGVPATYFELDSRHGHHAAGSDWAMWAPVLERFLNEVAA